MDDTAKALFSEYEDIQRSIKELEDKRDAMKETLVKLIPEGSIIDTGTATFAVQSRAKWMFTEATQEMEATLKEKQKEEQMTGVATRVDGEPFVVCKFKPM